MPKKKNNKAGGGGGSGTAGGKKNEADAVPKEESAPALNSEESVPKAAGDFKANTSPMCEPEPEAKEHGESCAPAAGKGDEDAAEFLTKEEVKSPAAATTPEQEVVKEALPGAAKEEEVKDSGKPPRAGIKEGDGAAPASDGDKKAGERQDDSKSSVSDGAGQPYPSGKVLRNDEECFLAGATTSLPRKPFLFKTPSFFPSSLPLPLPLPLPLYLCLSLPLPLPPSPNVDFLHMMPILAAHLSLFCLHVSN